MGKLYSGFAILTERRVDDKNERFGKRSAKWNSYEGVPRYQMIENDLPLCTAYVTRIEKSWQISSE